MKCDVNAKEICTSIEGNPVSAVCVQGKQSSVLHDPPPPVSQLQGRVCVLQEAKLLLPASGGRGRSFEASAPPSQLPVGGDLRWHWRSWLSSGVEDWVVDILRFRFLVPLHHLPPGLQEPLKFISYSLGSVRAQALRRSGQDAERHIRADRFLIHVTTVGCSWYRRCQVGHDPRSTCRVSTLMSSSPSS